jgi:predicted glycosyltransferase
MRDRTDVWVDLDNTPHVPFFRPIIHELRKRGHTVFVTSRRAFQVCEMADLFQMDHTPVGKHYGRNRLLKIAGLVERSLQLLPWAWQQRPLIALSHGSRSQLLLCNLLRIPTVMIMDYEHAKTPLLLRPTWEIVPEALTNAKLHAESKDRILTYPGLKEDVYAPDFVPDRALPCELGLDPDRVTVTARPPASEAHYHHPDSDALFDAFMELALTQEHVQIVLLPRNRAQHANLRQQHPDWFASGSVIVPSGALDGLNLLWHSDLVVSGGGTMNREAAALGVPVYSIFRGPIGRVDRQLQVDGRLVLVANAAELRQNLVFERRVRGAPLHVTACRHPALDTILGHIDDILSGARSAFARDDLPRGHRYVE